jgi:hypothetical protein
MFTLATLWTVMPLFREPLIVFCILVGPALAALLAAAETRR